jgi:hypothetical protein
VFTSSSCPIQILADSANPLPLGHYIHSINIPQFFLYRFLQKISYSRALGRRQDPAGVRCRRSSSAGQIRRRRGFPASLISSVPIALLFSLFLTNYSAQGTFARSPRRYRDSSRSPSPSEDLPATADVAKISPEAVRTRKPPLFRRRTSVAVTCITTEPPARRSSPSPAVFLCSSPVSRAIRRSPLDGYDWIPVFFSLKRFLLHAGRPLFRPCSEHIEANSNSPCGSSLQQPLQQ